MNEPNDGDDADDGGAVDNLDDDGTGKADVPLGKLPPLTRVYDDGHLQIDVENPVADETALAFAARVGAAYDYVAQAHQWTHPDKLAAAYNVKVITVATMKTVQPGAAAFCANPDVIVVSDRLLADGFGDGTLAHELSHMQHKRMGGRLLSFLEEGTAQEIQRQYSLMLGQDAATFTREARLLRSVTRDDAVDVIANFRTGPDIGMSQRAGTLVKHESLGCLFVEFVRARYQGGYGDVVARVAWIVEQIPVGLRVSAPGYDVVYTDAFTQMFGVDNTVVEAAFVAYVSNTVGHPVARLRDTMFAGW